MTWMARFNDGIKNVAKSMGLGAKGSALTDSEYGVPALTNTPTTLERMYRGEWLAAATVDIPAEDMTAKGVSFTGDDDPDDLQRLEAAIDRYQVWRRVQSMIKWGRLYGGAICWMDIAGQNPNQPLNPDRVPENSFMGLQVFDRWQLSPNFSQLVRHGPHQGTPLSYDVIQNYHGIAPVPGKFEAIFTVHHTRALRHIGREVPYRERIRELFWGASVIEQSEDRIRAYGLATIGVAEMAPRASTSYLQIKDFRQAISSGKEGDITKYVSCIKRIESLTGYTLIDEGDQVFQQNRNFAGADGILNQMGQQVSGSTGIPLTRLHGVTASGFNSGDSDLQGWAKTNLSNQESQLGPELLPLFRTIFKSEIGKPASENFGFNFNPLYEDKTSDKVKLARDVLDLVVLAIEADLMDKPEALKELMQQSKLTGFLTNITDEHVKEAENEPEEFQPPEIAGIVPGSKTPEQAIREAASKAA